MPTRRTILAFLSVCLLALGGCNAGEQEDSTVPPTIPPPTAAASPAEPTPTPVTIEEVLTALPDDVDPDDPGAYAVACACYYGLLQADAEGHFRPDDPADQGTAAAALLRLSGEEVPDHDETGQSDRQVTRAELAAMLCRQSPPDCPAGVLDAFQDADRVPEDARPALGWAVDAGVFRGFVDSCLLPDFPVSRAQLAQALVCLEALSDEAEPVVKQCARHCADRKAVGVSFEMADTIQAVIDETAEKYGAMGIQAAVVENGILCGSFAGGWASPSGSSRYQDAEKLRAQLAAGEESDSAGKLLSVDHKLRCASVSKVVVGMAALSLAEDGVVDLQEDIGTYWDCTIHSSGPVCIDHILSHTSAIARVGDSVPYTKAWVRGTLSSKCTGAKGGDVGSWAYNNFAFGVLGMTLELASGQMLDDVLNERFFDLLDIDAAFRPAHVAQQDLLTPLCRGGTVENSVERQRRIGELSTTPGSFGGIFSGGLTISARDLAKLVCVLAGDGCYEGVRVLDADSAACMEQSIGTTADGFQQCRPLRWRSDMYGRDQLFYHTGSGWGMLSCLSYDPVSGDGVVVLTNGAGSRRDEYGVYSVCGEINQAVYDLLKQHTQEVSS